MMEEFGLPSGEDSARREAMFPLSPYRPLPSGGAEIDEQLFAFKGELSSNSR
jgi:hypothetical protein